MIPIPEALGVIPGFWDWGARVRSDWINRNGFLYALDFEARLNLDILDALNLDDINGKTFSGAFMELMNSFETSAIRTLISGRDRKNFQKLVQLLKKHWKVTVSLEPEDKGNQIETISDAMDAFRFTAQKIEVLKRISRIAREETVFLKEINLKTRLKNINETLLGIHNCLAAVIREL